MNSPPWWQEAVFYQIYPRSFATSNASGVGNLEGIREHLDDLVWLGVDALWISPFYRSPMADFGYDVSDYCDVDPLFGDLAGFDALLDEAHQRGLRVIIDWVPNHTSNEHPWFLDARSGPDARHRNFYVWRNGKGDNTEPPNNWVSAFDPGQPAWKFVADDRLENGGQWYLHLFDPAQPDLNWDEPAVEQAHHDILRFWLDRGVDGFRADVIHCIAKDPALPDDPVGSAGIPHCALNDVEAVHPRLRRLRSLLDSYPGDRMMLGEVYLFSTEAVATYYGTGDELHLAFNFPPLYAPWRADKWRQVIEATSSAFDPRGAWPTWVLSNHDNPRHRQRYDDQASRHGEDEATRHRRSMARARAAAVLLLTLRGTPFLYQGEELGLLDAVIDPRRRVDPGGRDGCRHPIPWTAGEDHGWPGEPWLPHAPEAERQNVESLKADEGSILHLYRRLLDLRRRFPELRRGSFTLLDSPPGTLSFRRSLDHEKAVIDIRINFGGEPVVVPLEAGAPEWILLASGSQGSGTRFPGVLGPDEAVLLGALA